MDHAHGALQAGRLESGVARHGRTLWLRVPHVHGTPANPFHGQFHTQSQLCSVLGLIDSLAIYIMVSLFMSVWSSCSFNFTPESAILGKEFIVRMDEQMAREQPMKKTTLHNFISASTSLTLVTWSPSVSAPRSSLWSSTISGPDSSLWSSSVSGPDPLPDHSSATELLLSFRCQINSFSMVHRSTIVIFEPGWSGSGGHCMILMTRYLLVSRVEHEVNNDLKVSLLGRDSISGLYNLRRLKCVQLDAAT